MKRAPVGKVVWREEEACLTLEGEAVLNYRLRWPQAEAGGRRAGWFNRCYAGMAEEWRRRWRRELYWLACLDLAACRARARPFTPWKGELGGEVTLEEGGLISLCMEGREEREEGRICRVRWGDVWRREEGAPCPLRELLPPGRRWKKELCRALIREGERQQREGECLLDPGWQRQVRSLVKKGGCCLRGTELEFAFPQCTLAPAEEGTPVFRIPGPGAEG